MNNQFQQNQRGELDSSKFVNKKSYRKFVLRFVVVVVGVFVLFIMVVWGWQKYRYWQDEKIAQKAEEGIRKWQQEDYERAMADTYGGKTPQETLQMYIDAVERGIMNWRVGILSGVDRRKKKNSYLKPSEVEIKEYIIIVKNANSKIRRQSGRYDIERIKTYFSLYKPFLIRDETLPQ